MGKPSDPGYWRRWRAAHPEYRQREAARSAQRRRRVPRGDRSEEYRRAAAKRPSRAAPPLPQLYPELQHGRALSFREDEIRMDVAQERALALLEGRDPDQAADAYWARETSWLNHTAPLGD